MRVAIVRALGNLRNPLAIKPLSRALDDEDDDVELTAVVALSKIDSPLAVRPLTKAAKTGGYYARMMAEQALFKRRIRPPEEK